MGQNKRIGKKWFKWWTKNWKDDAWEWGLCEDSKSFSKNRKWDENGWGICTITGIYPLMTLVKYHHWC